MFLTTLQNLISLDFSATVVSGGALVIRITRITRYNHGIVVEENIRSVIQRAHARSPEKNLNRLIRLDDYI